MELVSDLAQVCIAVVILNVWIFRPAKSSPWRGGAAGNMRDEFREYGLPGWAFFVIGSLKIACATLLLAGIWRPELTLPAGIGLAALMLSAVLMHLKIRDPLAKSLPAASILALCMLVLLN